MGGLSIWHVLILVGLIAAVWGLIRIVWRTGVSLLWLIPLLIPFVAPFAFLWLSYVRWPKIDRV